MQDHRSVAVGFVHVGVSSEELLSSGHWIAQSSWLSHIQSLFNGSGTIIPTRLLTTSILRKNDAPRAYELIVLMLLLET